MKAKQKQTTTLMKVPVRYTKGTYTIEIFKHTTADGEQRVFGIILN